MPLLVLKVCFVLLMFCASASAQVFETTSAPIPAYRHPELLFLTAQPYSRLYVEIDAVEGAEPSQKIIQALQKFLNKYCDKPDGIQIVQNRSIPRSQANGLPEEVLAWRYMNGIPSGIDSAKSAYLYVLFFDSRISGTATSSEGAEPYTSPRYPCAIFIDAAYWQSNFHKFVPRIICHEMGHLIGLVKNTRHGDGAHCENRSCLMFPTHSEERALASVAYREGFDLCSDCQADLTQVKKQLDDPKLSFLGPALVRTERYYRVIQLPNIVYWDYAPFKALDWRFITRVASDRWKKQGTENSLQYITYRSPSLSQENEPFQTALQRSLKDPDPKVVSLVREIRRMSLVQRPRS
jgi:hypothetical protein